MAHEVLDALRYPALAVGRDDGNARTSDMAIITLDTGATQHKLSDLAPRHALLAHQLEACRQQFLDHRRVGFEVRRRHLYVWLAFDHAAVPAHIFGDVFCSVVLADPHVVMRHPLELVFGRDLLRPGRRALAEFGLKGGMGVRRQHIAALRVRLVLALCIEVEEHRRVGVKDRLHTDGLPVVVLVLVVFVLSAQAPSAHAALYSIVECIVIGFVGRAALLVGAIKAVKHVGESVILCAVTGLEIDGRPVRPKLILDA